MRYGKSQELINPKQWPPAGIKWYYADEWVAIACADCREILPELPKVDLVLTDPPYGIDLLKKPARLGKSRIYQPISGDTMGCNLSFLFEATSNLIIFGGNYFSLPISRGWIVWDKQGGKQTTYGDCELIYTSFDNPPRITTHIWDGFRRDSDKDTIRTHPAQKPVGLISKLIIEFTKDDDFILDPFLGSGSTLVACKALNRKCIGIEIEEKYCEIAAKRCSQGVFNFGV